MNTVIDDIYDVLTELEESHLATLGNAQDKVIDLEIENNRLEFERQQLADSMTEIQDFISTIKLDEDSKIHFSHLAMIHTTIQKKIKEIEDGRIWQGFNQARNSAGNG